MRAKVMAPARATASTAATMGTVIVVQTLFELQRNLTLVVSHTPDVGAAHCEMRASEAWTREPPTLYHATHHDSSRRERAWAADEAIAALVVAEQPVCCLRYADPS